MNDKLYSDWMRAVPIGGGIYVGPDVYLRNCVIHTHHTDWHKRGEIIFAPIVPLD